MKRLLPIKDFCAAYGVGRTRTYQLINDGLVEAVKDGPNKTLISVESAERWAASLPRLVPASPRARA